MELCRYIYIFIPFLNILTSGKRTYFQTPKFSFKKRNQ